MLLSDYSILDEKVPYVVGPELSTYEHEKGMVFTYSDTKATLLEHCLKSLHLIYEFFRKSWITTYGWWRLE